MSDHHYCPFCGASDAFCGCPDDPHTTDKMHCPHCGGRWRRDYGSTSTTCLHAKCRKEGSTVEEPAKYAPTLPDTLREVLEGAAVGELYRSTRSASNGWKLRGTALTADAALLRRWGYIKDADADDHWISVLLTDAGRRLLDHMRDDGYVDGTQPLPFHDDED